MYTVNYLLILLLFYDRVHMNWDCWARHAFFTSCSFAVIFFIFFLFMIGYRWTYLFLSTWSIDQNQWLFINLLIVLHCQLLKINEFFLFQMFTCKVKKNLTEKTKTEFFGKKRSHQPKIEWPTSFSLISFSSVSAKVKGAGALPEVKCFLYPDKFTSSLK